MNNWSPLPPESAKNDLPRQQENFFRRLGRGWMRFSGPDQKRFSSSFEDQERLRRSRVLSALFPLTLVAVFTIIPIAVPVPIYWIPILTLFGLTVLAFLCNRLALVNLSGLFVILAIDATITILMLLLPTGIRNSNIPDFDLLVISTLIGGIILPRRALPFLAIFHMALIVALFALLPHDPLLNEEVRVNQRGVAYGELNDALLLQIVGATIAWLNARSVDRALLRAGRAEELAEAQRRLNEQAQRQVEQKERLEYGIEVLKETHARFANGDYRARAVLQDNELASLAISFNLLADRLNRIARDAQELASLKLAFQQLLAIQEEVVYGGRLRYLAPTGTMVDRVYPWLKQYFLFRQMYNRSSVVLEKARFALTRQRSVLAQLQTALDEIRVELRLTNSDTRRLSPAFALIERAQNLCEQVEEQGRFSLQEAKQLDEMLRV